MFEKQSPVRENIEKIALECREAGASEWETAKVVKTLMQAEEAEADIHRLRKRAILELKQLNSKAAQTYASFNKLNVYVSAQRIESFDRGNIARSLLRETGVPRNIAEKIAVEVEDKIKDLGLQELSTSLIREMADVKLFEYGLGNFHREYARVGMPAHEVKLELQEGKIPDARQMMREYNLLNALSDEARKMHFEADLHFVALEDYSTRPYAIALEFQEEPKSEAEAVEGIARELGAKMGVFSLVPSVLGLNSWLAGLNARGKRMKAIASAALGAMGAVAGRREALFSVNMFSGKSLGKREREEENLIALELVARAQERSNLRPAVCFDSKFQLKLFDEKLLSSASALFLQQRDSPSYAFSDGNSVPARVIASEIALNLERLALLSDGQQSFWEFARERVHEARKCFAQRREILSTKPYVKPEWLEEGKDAIAISSPEGAALALLGSNAEQREVAALSEKMVERLRKEIGEGAVLCRVSDPEAMARFEAANSGMRAQGAGQGGIQSSFGKRTARSPEELRRLVEEGACAVELVH